MSGDTIFALASAPGKAGIAVVRLSGPGAAAALADLAGDLPPPRQARHVRLRDPLSGETIDDAIALFFPAPKSYTGEDVAELHIHGSRAVLAALFEILAAREGLRLAEPGEYTKRAFLNFKLDLTAAEGLADLVEAETAAQRKQARLQLDGAFGRLCEDWRGRLLRAQAQLEAEIDFAEEDLPQALIAASRAEVARIAAEIAAHLADNRRGERLRDGVAVAIVGPPNAGKSSLMNALARRDVAITSAVAGTTRDVIEVHLDLAGYPVVLADTAGLRGSSDEVEAEGVRRARARAATADLRLIVLDATKPDEAAALGDLVAANALVIVNKIDLLPSDDTRWADALGAGAASRLSVASGAGMKELLDRLGREVASRLGETGTPLVTRARHREALETAVASLRRLPAAPLPELAAEDLRVALRALGRITGRVDVEDMLDVLFREFCIGK
jgi:tRNA modification GTPase